MSEISNASAKRDHGVSTYHSRMPNGELRFRLKKRDGTAYIRTEADELNGGWQKSHFHGHVMETYIVQSGWMAFAELIGSDRSVTLYQPGQIVTSRPGIVHNVYLPRGAVIHTVKHGSAEGEDWLTDDRTAAFDKVTSVLSGEADVRAASIHSTVKTQYSDEYRHFDTLIWQVPAWSTAIFALSIQALFGVMGSSSAFEMRAAGLLALFTALALGCFAFVMLRFRCHQHRLKGYRSTPKWRSASTVTQGLITLEALVLLAIGLMIFRMLPYAAIGLAVLLAMVFIPVCEYCVERSPAGHPR